MAKQKRFILSIDGGGIRGLVQARILMALGDALAARGDVRPLHKVFDLIAGTSTGGILAAGLALLQARLGAETCLKDALTDLVLTAYDIQNRHTRFMGNTPTIGGGPSDTYLAWQAVRATSAAPTYFPPMLVDNLSKNGTRRQESLVDGGLFANDPTLAAIVEARKLGWDLEDLCVISIGSGQSTQRFDHARARRWGQLGWIKPTNGVPIISSFMQAQAEAIAYQARHLLGQSGMAKGPLTYHRIDAPLKGVSDALDDTTSAHLAALDRFADQIIAERQSDLAIIADLLQPASI